MTAGRIQEIIADALKNLGIEAKEVLLEHPAELSHGDYSTNVALAHSKELKMKPKELAERIVETLKGESLKFIERIEIAGPGFINFHLSTEFFAEAVKGINDDFGKNTHLAGKKVMVEYTDPNPFKEFHIGHLMSNAIGESISRLIEFQGAEVKRACYQGDVGLHVAKAIWGILDKKINDSELKIQGLARGYVWGAWKYKTNAEAKKEIEKLNEKIFEKSDPDINKLYELGKKISLEYFDQIYKKLGTKFDYSFFESETGAFGKKIVEEFLGKGVFEKSDGAIIFPGEKHGLHTRVFINSQGLPTYEAKELGLAKIKYDTYKYDKSVVITGNEVNEYFKVLLCVMNLIFPELARKTKHLSHGMLRLPTGKMSSREGNVINEKALISGVESMVHKKLEDRELETFEKNKIAEAVTIGAIKYSILRQAIGGDIIFDFEKSISLEGDSGPYLQYSYTRAKSVLERAKRVSESLTLTAARVRLSQSSQATHLARLLYRFPEVVERASEEYAPHHIVTFLTELASVFNSWYAKERILDAEEETSYRLALARAFSIVMKNGLRLLGIEVPKKM